MFGKTWQVCDIFSLNLIKVFPEFFLFFFVFLEEDLRWENFESGFDYSWRINQ